MFTEPGMKKNEVNLPEASFTDMARAEFDSQSCQSWNKLFDGKCMLLLRIRHVEI